MRIGVFTKMDMAGGSEFRAVELANALSRLEGTQGVLLSQKKLPERIRGTLERGVEHHSDIFSTPTVELLYGLDRLLVINSDSRDFTKADFWLGRTEGQSTPVELCRIRNLTFLFNFIVSPACQLSELRRSVPDIRIITANSKFFDEISKQDRYLPVRHYPRLHLESPIFPEVIRPKVSSDRIRFGMHSLPNESKWNAEFPELVRTVNERAKGRVAWDFMGVPESVRKGFDAGNITCRPAFSIPVADFLQGIDVFVFFLGWKREEAWARSAAEALMSGCPIVTTDRGGNRDQVLHGNTGFLCRTFAEMVEGCLQLANNADLRHAMAANARSSARQFTSEKVAKRLVEFLQ